MEIRRDEYIAKLERLRGNGRIKIITGLRRCGKSYLLFRLFKNHLLDKGVKETSILELSLENLENARYRNPFALLDYFRSRMEDIHGQCYIFIDEIQFCSSMDNPDSPGDKITFVDALLSLSKHPDADIYITGSNSKMLSSDILTQFRDRGDEIKVLPLSYSEFYEACPDKTNAWLDYMTHGGMPYSLQLSTHEEKAEYLRKLFKLTYIRDIAERNNLSERDQEAIGIILDFLSSAIGSLTNPSRLENRFVSERKMRISHNDISRLIGYIEDAFIISSSKRYDLKGNAYFDTPLKYYFTDIGLRNARINFRQTEETHTMENIIYNELIRRGCSVDVGVVESITKNKEGKSQRSKLEIDFVVNSSGQRIYIQSAFSVSEKEKQNQETRSLKMVHDSFKKIVITGDRIYPWFDQDGIYYINLQDFLLNRNSLVF